MLNQCRRGSGAGKSLRSKGNGMRLLIVGMIMSCAVLNAAAADDSIYGTHWVRYEPIQVAGQLAGCSLVYLAVTADRAYLNGNPVAINGSFILRADAGNRGVAVGLKTGLKDLNKNGAVFERPNFAYLQTEHSSTAKAKGQSFDGEDGYKVFAYSIADPAILAVLKDLATAGKTTIGYNRKAGGMDVSVPLDLMVIDSEYAVDQKVIRKRAASSAVGFSTCVASLLDDVLGKMGPK